MRSSSSVDVFALVDRLFPLESRVSEAFLVRRLRFWCTASLTRSMSVLLSDNCPELVCEWDPMLWLLSSRRTLSNVGILPFDLHTFDVYVEIEPSPFGALHEHW